VQQDDFEPPVTFLQRLKDASQKHINVKPGPQEEEIILKDKFLTQLILDIHKTFQKLLAKGSRDLDQMVQTATSV
jgi:hypothetical protein